MTQEELQLKVNRKNVLGWLALIRDVYPWTDDERNKINKFIKTRYTVRRDKLLDEIFGEEE